MMCMDCSGELRIARENYQYTECGLPSVTLCDVEVRRCGACGAHEVAIPNIEGLHRAIALHLIQKPRKFTGAEIRFLRKSMGLCGADFAERIGASPSTVSRWEHDHDEIGPTYDRLLRMMVANSTPVESYPMDMLGRIDEKATSPLRMGMRVNRERWEPQPLCC